MLRSRVTSGVDMVRLGNALSRPGIDPRIWVSYATLTSDVYVDTEAGSQGVFADVQLLPSGVEDTARVGAIYAGNGFGLYTPLHKDDEVLVVAPSGDPDEGLVIVQRLWSTSDPQPAEVVQDANDVVLVVEPDKNLRVAVKGAGGVIINAEDGGVAVNVAGSGDVQVNVDSGKVYLGQASGTEPATKGTSLKAYLDNLRLAIATHIHAVTGTLTPPTAVAGVTAVTTTPIPSAPSSILADKVEVK